MRVISTRPWLLLAMLISCALSGCLTGDGENSNGNPIDMEVYYESTSGTIEEVVQNGATLSQNGVELSFDFARVTSKAGNMKSFSYDPGDDDDGSNTIEVNANEQAEISYTYQTHGMFSAVLTATDESDNTETITLQIRIDKQVQWTQTNTNNPAQMLIPTTPDCDCPVPEKIDIDSTITNRNSFPPGPAITVTWHINNPDGEEQAFHTEQIGEGDDGGWTHSQYNLVGGDWALEVTVDTTDGNDERIDIAHTVIVLYEPLESEPNPFSAEDSDS
ncbi:MAG: hypothetical protein CMA65_01620 [Euryarchaeota archaeon]|nr:hypothetical protein [Euryarchaeota archaeon]